MLFLILRFWDYTFKLKKNGLRKTLKAKNTLKIN